METKVLHVIERVATEVIGALARPLHFVWGST